MKQQVVRSDGWDYVSGNAQEIAVVIDGDWQDDPISHSHNFKLDLAAGLSF